MAKQATPNDRPVPKEGMGAFVGGFAPGQAIRVYQEGTAMKLPAKPIAARSATAWPTST